jgi:hypothetical protein
MKWIVIIAGLKLGIIRRSSRVLTLGTSTALSLSAQFLCSAAYEIATGLFPSFLPPVDHLIGNRDKRLKALCPASYHLLD